LHIFAHKTLQRGTTALPIIASTKIKDFNAEVTRGAVNTHNAPGKTFWWPSSARIRWGSLQRSLITLTDLRGKTPGKGDGNGKVEKERETKRQGGRKRGEKEKMWELCHPPEQKCGCATEYVDNRAS